MVIAYLRVSTGKQHLENQYSEITRFAEQKNLEVDRWVTEVVSGRARNSERKLGRLLKSLQSGDILIVTELSRLSRSLHEVMAIMGNCLDKKITVYSTKDGYAFDDSINSKVLSFAFGLVAEIERNLISQRTKEALALRKAEGKVLGRKVGDAPKMRDIEARRPEIEEWIRAGVSIAQIARRLRVSIETFRQYRQAHPDVNAMLTQRFSVQKKAELAKKATFLRELREHKFSPAKHIERKRKGTKGR